MCSDREDPGKRSFFAFVRFKDDIEWEGICRALNVCLLHERRLVVKNYEWKNSRINNNEKSKRQMAYLIMKARDCDRWDKKVDC